MHDDFKKDVGARGKFSKRTSKKYRNPILKTWLEIFRPEEVSTHFLVRNKKQQ